MKGIKIKMNNNERDALCNMTRMFIACLELSPTNVGYINSIVLKNWFKKLEEKIPYLQGERSITINLECMSIFQVCANAFLDKLPPYEYTICLQLIEMIDKAVSQDKTIMSNYQKKLQK